MEVEIERAKPFEVLYDLPEGTNMVVCIGGRGGMKTYEVSKFAAYSATMLNKRIVVVRDERERIKESILNEIWERYDTANIDGLLSPYFIKNDIELKAKYTNKVLIYTMGFRASTTLKVANLKGVANIDIAIVEEFEDIVDADKFNTFVDSLRKEGCVVILMLNTPNIGHFIIKRLFNTKQVADGYYEIIPKNIPGFVCIKTNFRDNPHLPPHVIANYQGYGDPTHHLYNYHYYMTSIQGYASTGRKGQVFTKVKPMTLAEYQALRLTEVYGQDFGTASPAALTAAKFDGNTVYARLLSYKPMPVLELAKMYCEKKFNDRDRIVCDYAEPNTISKLKNGFKDLDRQDYIKYPALSRGFFAVECPSKDLQARISLMQSLTIYVVEDKDAWEEINNYVYAQDKYGNYTDTPIDAYNHFLDALGYVIDDQRGRKKMFGI
jgi:PBSX family phage terminase large subunit